MRLLQQQRRILCFHLVLLTMHHNKNKPLPSCQLWMYMVASAPWSYAREALKYILVYLIKTKTSSNTL